MIRFAAPLTASLIALAAPAAAEKVVVTADRYLDVASGRYVELPAIFIGDDGRITSIADARVVKWGADVRHIDMSGKTLLPGLIDMHVHLDSPADIGGYRGLEYTDSFFGMTAVGNARAMLDAGFTTVRNVGSANRNDVGLAQAISDGYAIGPRIVPAGYALDATGGVFSRKTEPGQQQLTEAELRAIADVRVLKSVAFVMARGEVVKHPPVSTNVLPAP